MRPSKGTKNLNQVSLPSRTRVVSNQVENQIPSSEQEGLSPSCGTTTDETKDLFLQQNVGSDRLKMDEDDMTCLLGNIPKKSSKSAKGRCNASSAKLQNRSVLLCKEHCENKPTIISDDSGASNNVEEETALHHGVGAEPTHIDVEEKDNDLLSSFLQNRPKRQ
ncbi:hypothetical protein RJT34_02246 [Clitoria ternatea]|uniref:Uncharacterized protein n=1 Tax=Clitoria ternatea TaxID=43366 RepID=A0AAN9KKA0_CLITE